MKIGHRIKELRKKFGLRQLDLANSLGVSPQAVSRWEKDDNFPDIYLLRKMARLFDLSLDSLLGMYEEKNDVFEATVFCSGINHFADRARELSAKELAQWTNVVLHHMTDIVLGYGGIPVKYTGDGFLCFFSGTDHAQRAFTAACDIDRINTDKDIVMFLNAGEIFFGLVGHPDYASKDIYGDVVNRTFLIMDAFSKRVRKGIGITPDMEKMIKGEKERILIENLEVPVLNETIAVYVKE
jgi:transcriptional regulator with XRE-family HTH domain